MVFVKNKLRDQIDQEYEKMMKEEELENSIVGEHSLVEMNGEYYQKEGFF